MTTEYYMIVTMAVISFVLLYLNPVSFQNKTYHINGTECPDALWHSLLTLLIGTLIFLFVNNFKVMKK